MVIGFDLRLMVKNGPIKIVFKSWGRLESTKDLKEGQISWSD
jgi:hypothetical protein